MKKVFTYSILQYKHSLLLNEALNVGILFLFPEDRAIRFVSGNLSRLKLIYPNADNLIIGKIVKNIDDKIRHESTPLFDISSKSREDIQNSLLKEDDSSLQFSNPKTSAYPFDDLEKIISQFCELLLPNNDPKRSIIKHNENYIIKKYINFITEKNNRLEKLISKNKLVEAGGIKLRFEIAWKNGTTNLVKPLSFDLQEGLDIQNKSITYFGYLTKLNDYAELNKIRYDLLIAEPQEKSLLKEYENAISIINSAKSPKRLVMESELKSYSEETIASLYKKYDEFL